MCMNLPIKRKAMTTRVIRPGDGTPELGRWH